MQANPHVSLFTALSIAGFDGSGGAGLQADLKTFSALGCYGATVLTALPIQNTTGVKSIFPISASCVSDQIKAVLDDIPMNAIKLGMLHTQAIIEAVARSLHAYQIKNLVIDPVMVAKSGDKLLLSAAITTLKRDLFPLATVLTPNLPEASALLGRAISQKCQMEEAALELLQLGPQAVVLKGGHLTGDCDDCVCIDGKCYWLSAARIPTRNTHGTGCTFSAAIAAYLAQGCTILESIRQSKAYITQAIAAGATLKIGQGYGPVHHFFNIF